MAEETDLVTQYIAGTLAADTATLGVLSTGICTRVYDSIADQDEETFPLIVFSMQAALDDFMTNAARRVWASYLFQVKVIGKNHTYAELSPIASRIDALLHRGADGGTHAGIFGKEN